jgi:hypothetical protein
MQSLGSGGVNCLLLAFFDPSKMTGACNFTDPNTPCVAPATGSGGQGLSWVRIGRSVLWGSFVFCTMRLTTSLQILSSVQAATGMLSNNTAPVRGTPPVMFITFGGANEGGAPWDALFGSASTASNFGTNAAALASAVSAATSGAALIGIDLDIEATSTTLPHFSDFIVAFRSAAPYASVPLQLCVLSGMAQPANSDHFKLALLQANGPAQGGVSHVNFMVAPTDESCASMAAYWLDPALAFLPNSSRVWGVWGEIQPSLILHDPGCSPGSPPALFPAMAAAGIGVGVWEWWTGSTDGITAVLDAVRSGQ